MGWSTDLFCNISYNRKTYNSIYEVDADIRELDACIKYAEDTLRDLAIMTEPNKLLSSKEDLDESPYSKIVLEFQNSIQSLREYYVERWKLQLLVDNWDECHNKEGLALDPPDNIHWNSAFITGDCINSIKYPKRNE